MDRRLGPGKYYGVRPNTLKQPSLLFAERVVLVFQAPFSFMISFRPQGYLPTG